MDNTLTDRAFWANYWDSKHFDVEVGSKYLFHKQFRKICAKDAVRSSIEIGGFPGYFSVFLAKYCDVDTTLLDFYVDRSKIQELCKANDLDSNKIQTIETDFLSYQSDRTYDLVFSCGLIEHFENYDDLIAKHVGLLAPGGQLFIEIPNLRGINGWIQKRFDPENLAIHNLECMDLARLHDVASEMSLIDVNVEYNGRYGIWLEKNDQQSRWERLQFRTINFSLRKLSKLYRRESKLMSPYITLTARKDSNALTKSDRKAA